jgi:hypothetical protein
MKLPRLFLQNAGRLGTSVIKTHHFIDQSCSGPLHTSSGILTAAHKTPFHWYFCRYRFSPRTVNNMAITKCFFKLADLFSKFVKVMHLV